MKQHKAIQEDIKSINKKLVFRTIAREAPISRAGIKKHTNLAATTVSTLVDEYIEQGFLSETGLTQTHAVGRKSMMLTVNCNGGFFLVLDVHKDNVLLFVYDLQLGSREVESVPYGSEKDLYRVLVQIIQQVKTEYSTLLSVAIALPALIHAEQRKGASSVLGFTVDIDALQEIRQQFETLRIEFCNTSGLAAYAQTMRYPEVRNLISVDVSEGVGSGIIIDGSIYHGKNGVAGELGHICMDLHGEPCACGGKGCLEHYISIPVILRRISKRIGKTIDLSKAVEMFHHGDGAAIEVMTSAAGRLALALNTVINLFDPELVIISGAICLFGDDFYNMVSTRLHELSLLGVQRDVRFMQTDENLVSLGGANYLFDMYFT